MEKCPVDIENAHYDELFYYALYGKPGVLKDDDPVLLTFMNQTLPPEKQVPVPEIETDDPILLDLLGKKKLPEPPLIVEKLPDKLKEAEKADEELPVYRRSYILNFDWSIVKGEYRALDYDKYLEVDESKPSARMCRLLTMVCFKLLFYLEQHLLVLLQKCKSDLSIVKDKIRELKSSGEKDSGQKMAWLNIYGIPYFKDNKYFSSPPNAEYLKKRRNRELLFSYMNTKSEWSTQDNCRLENAIKNEEIIKHFKQTEREKLKLSKYIAAVEDEVQKAELQQKFNALPSEQSIRKMSLEQLCEDINWEYDWLKISAQDFEGNKDPEECRNVWRRCLHPKVNKSSWTNNECDRLKELVKKYKFQNWDAIAEELGTNRNGLQVMQQYQRKLNVNFLNKPWSQEEDEQLVKIVQRCRNGARIPWRTVAARLKGHTKQQIFRRWTYNVNPELSWGPFTKYEDMLLVAAVRSYGQEYSRMVELCPYRSCEQLRHRYKTLKKRELNPWNNNNNEKLLSLVNRFGEGKWKEISEFFTGQTCMSLKEQYAILKERIKKGTISDEIEEDTVCEEQKVWKRIQRLLPNLKDSNKVSDSNLNRLKKMLKRDMVPIQKSERVSLFDKECYSYLKCVSGPNTLFENEPFENKKKLHNPRILQCLLHLLHAKLQVPQGGFMSLSHHLLQKRDKEILQQLVKESFMVSDLSKEPAVENRVMKYSMPPNFATLSGFRSMLLNREYLLNSLTQNNTEVNEVAKQPDNLLKQRLGTLFLWPALASTEAPAINKLRPDEDVKGFTSKSAKLKQNRTTREIELEFIRPEKRPKLTRAKRAQNYPIAECPIDLPCTSTSFGNMRDFAEVKIKNESIYNTSEECNSSAFGSTSGSLNSVNGYKTYGNLRKPKIEPPTSPLPY